MAGSGSHEKKIKVCVCVVFEKMLTLLCFRCKFWETSRWRHPQITLKLQLGRASKALFS